jgi:putative dimethyl sulfoxide reductase chaperone
MGRDSDSRWGEMNDFVGVYKLLSLGLSYPDAASWSDLKAILDAAESVIHSELLKPVESLKTLVATTSSTDMESDYLRIFDVGGRISPYETEYLTEKISRKPHELADIAGFYRAFFCDADESSQRKEAFDHIAVELEFMAFLGFKARYAIAHELMDQLEVVQSAKKKFLSEHLLKWGFFYCTQVQKLEGEGIYKALSNILELVLVAECVAFGFEPDSFRLEMERLPYEGIRGAELTCGQTCTEA